MKLAEALQERADLNRKIEQLSDRLEANVLVQEGEVPLEDPNVLKTQLDHAIDRLIELINAINRTNSQTVVNGQTLTALIAQKDGLSTKIGHYKSIVQASSRINYRARGSEIKILASINVSKWQSEIDEMAKQIRTLDNTLQQANWNTDLIE